MYKRQVPTLDRVSAAMALLGDPQRSFRVIQVTGTNGKTSTTRMIEALCREHGLRTGRFTSPHLHTMRERIAVDGDPVAPEVLIERWDEVSPILDLVDARSAETGEPRMTFFEALVVLGYAVFADAPVDVAVVTPVDLDHMHFLGSTVEQIATEKAGIISEGSVAVLAAQPDAVAEILIDRCAEVAATRYAVGEDLGLVSREVALGGQLLTIRGIAGEYDEVFLPLHGLHQADNAVLALGAVEAFFGAERRLDPDVVRAGFAAVTSPGRLEVVRRSPTILVDAAHNPHGMAALREALAESFSFARLVGVVAIFADKDAGAMLELLEPALEHVVVTANSSPRSMPPERLAAVARDIFGPDRVSVAAQLPDAIDLAVSLAEADGMGGGVVATGSVVTAADVRHLLGVTQA